MGAIEKKARRRKGLEWNIKKYIEDNHELIIVVYMIETGIDNGCLKNHSI